MLLLILAGPLAKTGRNNGIDTGAYAQGEDKGYCAVNSTGVM